MTDIVLGKIGLSKVSLQQRIANTEHRKTCHNSKIYKIEGYPTNENKSASR